MSKYNFSIPSAPAATNEPHPENLKKTWQHSRPVHGATAAGVYGVDKGDDEYVRIFNTHYNNFEGKILEIGAGTGWFAKQILTSCPNVEYTVLDIKRNIEDTIKHTLSSFPNVRYITSAEYEEALADTYDLFIATHCLSETPRYYYTDVLAKLKTKNCLVIDYGGDPNDPGFNATLEEWYTQFPHQEKSVNKALLGGAKSDIPVYIGKADKV
jgi:SAM-dependent MidA family methyltransferase